MKFQMPVAPGCIVVRGVAEPLLTMIQHPCSPDKIVLQFSPWPRASIYSLGYLCWARTSCRNQELTAPSTRITKARPRQSPTLLTIKPMASKMNLQRKVENIRGH